MIVPDYWAEAKLKERINGRQVTIKRFGWSNSSEEDALENATARAKEAMLLARQGETVRRADHKVSYNGNEGLPIREEVIARHDDVVITRNIYGALCLNTPDVLFADIDYPLEVASTLPVKLLLLVMGIGFAVGWLTDLMFWIGSAGILLGFVVLGITTLVQKVKRAKQPTPEALAMEKVKEYLSANADANLRVYKTPLGLRVLFMHKLFDPSSDDTMSILTKLDSDAIYIQMCKNQQCFRARVSPKPWRIGIERLTPRPGVWPISKDRLPARQHWVEAYTEKAENYAACEFWQQLGSSLTHPKAEKVRQLHDELSQAASQLDIA